MDDRLCFSASGKYTAGGNNCFTLGHSLAKVMAITLRRRSSGMDRSMLPASLLPACLW
jgi:hypothetical protein